MTKYLEILKSLISNRQNQIILIAIFIFVVFLIVDWTTSKKIPLVGIILLFVLGTFTVSYKFLRSKFPISVIKFLTKYFISVKGAILYFTLIFLAISITIYIFKINRTKAKSKFIIEGYGNLIDDVLFIVNRSGEVVYQTPLGLEIFNSRGNIIKTIKRNIDSILIDEMIIKKNSLFKHLNSQVELEGFVLTVSNKTEEKELDLEKKNIYKEDKYIGYIISKQSVSDKKTKPCFGIDQDALLNSFDEPIAYFDSKEKFYKLNNTMVNFLKVDGHTLSEEEFKSFVYPNDLSVFIQKPDELSLTKKNVFRLVIDERTFWFEATYNKDEVIIRRTSIINQRNKLQLNTHHDLAKDISKLLHEKKEFGLLSLSFINILDVNMVDGKDLSNALIAHYFKALLDGPYKNEIQLYQLGNIEFGLLVNNITSFDIITREIIENKTTSFKEVSYKINKENFKVELAVGIISSRNIDNMNSEQIINASYTALKEASDPEYPNNYSIYYPKTEVKEYRFEDFDIDLSEGFLEKYKID